MTLDYDLIREILEFVKEKGTGFTEHHFSQNNFEGTKEAFIIQVYHYNILIENGLIDGKSKIHPTFTPEQPTAVIYYKDLTLAGQQVLESMQNNNVWNNIKDVTVKAGVEGLKQIPALAVKVLTGL